MAIQFNTTQYEWAHSRKPRGRGSWAFYFQKPSGEYCLNPANDGLMLGREALAVWFAPGSMIYGEAKKWARAKARELGADSVEVGS